MSKRLAKKYIAAAELIAPDFNAHIELIRLLLPSKIFVCDALATVARHQSLGCDELQDPFARLFMPLGAHLDRPWFSRPMGGGSAITPVTQQHRILALCLMAAMAEAGDL